jgi:hypothetical protein
VPQCIALLFVLASCGTAAESPSAAVATSSPAASLATATHIPTSLPVPSPDGTAIPEPSGFAFEAADVIAYYQSIGYACAAPRPSTQAVGYFVVTCQLQDDAGRTRAVGIVTDSAGALGNGYATVQAATGQGYLSPDDALDPLAAFLGTMLGAERGAEAAIWMKAHLGESYATSTLGEITVATYTGTGDDPSQLFVEVADRAYVNASPAPSR